MYQDMMNKLRVIRSLFPIVAFVLALLKYALGISTRTLSMSNVWSIAYFISYLLPCVFLSVYVVFFFENKKTSYLSVAVVSVMLMPAIEILDLLINKVESSGVVIADFACLFGYAALLISFCVSKGEKVMMITATLSALFVDAFFVVRYIFQILPAMQRDSYFVEAGISTRITVWSFGMISTILVHIALFVVVFFRKKIVGKNMLSPEQQLSVLNEKFEIGIITKEQYDYERAQLINSL